MFRTARLHNRTLGTLAVGVLPMGVLALGGCEQTRPPTPEGLKLIKSRTATGTVYSKLEARSQPAPPRAGEISIWDFKIFEPKDKPDGTRTERKFFAPLPQTRENAGTTDVLMNAWLISDDLATFQPGKPSYKAYGSFVNGWTITKPGPTMLWVEYQPAERGKFFGREMARWHFNAAPSSNADYKTPLPLTPQKVARQGNDVTFAAQDAAGAPAHSVTLHHEGFRLNRSGRFDWKVTALGTIENIGVAALSPDRKTFMHWVSQSVLTSFDQPGDWRLWFWFEVGGEKFVAPYVLRVAK